MGEYTSVVVALVGVVGMLVGAWFARRAARDDAASSAVAVRAAKAVSNGAVVEMHAMDAEEKFMGTLIAQITTLQARMDKSDQERETVRITHDGERATWRIERDALRADCHKENEGMHAELVTTRQELMVATGRIDKLTSLLETKDTREWLERMRLTDGAQPAEDSNDG